MHDEDARAMSDFLLPMLEYDTSKRATAASMLKHPWIASEFDAVSAFAYL